MGVFTNQQPPRGELALRTVAMPADTNPAGDIFGGWIMSLMDLAAGVSAGTRARGRVATAAVSNLSFIQPVKVEVIKISIKALVQAEAGIQHGGAQKGGR